MKLNEAINVKAHLEEEVVQFNEIVCEGINLAKAGAFLATALGAGVGGLGGYAAGLYSAGAAATGGALGVYGSISAASGLLSIGLLPVTGVAVVFGSTILGAYALSTLASDLSDHFMLSRSAVSKRLVRNINDRDALLVKISNESKSVENSLSVDKYAKKLEKLTKEQTRLGEELDRLFRKDLKKSNISQKEFDEVQTVIQGAIEGRLTNIK